MSELAMFPLGSVLFPHMPLQLRVFEERYLVMLSRILSDEPAEFGVVLIERGQEVGGGEQRFAVGTVAQVTQLAAEEGFVVLVAEGERRIEVTQWLEEDPFPRAIVRELPALTWDERLRPLLETAERSVRRALAVASEFAEQQWSAQVELSDDPVAASWQLAGISPIGPLDEVSLLRSTSLRELLDGIIEESGAAAASISTLWADDVGGVDDGVGGDDGQP